MSNRNPLITIATVTFNCATSLEETILSIINQTYPFVEYIIIDGGSTDGTVDIIKKYQSKISYYISEPDRGIYDAMNKAIKVACGDFILFMGADDHLISYKILEYVAEKFDANDTKIYYGDVFRPFKNDIYRGKFNRYKLAIMNIPHQGIFYPKKIYKGNLYNIQYWLLADYCYNIRLYAQYRFEYLGITISYYNDKGSSAIYTDEKFKNDRRSIIIHHLGLFPYYFACLHKILRYIYFKVIHK